MIIKTKALVVKEYILGESDKYITLFTKDLGKIQAIAPKAKKADKGLASSTQLFVYGEFMLTSYGHTYRLMSVEVLSMFHDLRNDLNTLSYGSYILEFLAEVTQEGLAQEALLGPALITLQALIIKPLELQLLRRGFELRALCLLGFAPELYRCVGCGEEFEENANASYSFLYEAGGIVCTECIDDETKVCSIGYSTLYTMRYIASAPFKQLFQFSVRPAILGELEKVCNLYVSYYIDKRFKTLEFINQIESLV